MYEREVHNHPGSILEEKRAGAGWSVTTFARRLGIHRVSAHRLLTGRVGISPAVALALERIGWDSAEQWLNCQAQYDIAVARRISEEQAKYDVGKPS